MDKKSKIIMIVCIIIIVVGIGVATSIAIIKGSKKVELNKEETVQIENNEDEEVIENNEVEDLSPMTDDELENLL